MRKVKSFTVDHRKLNQGIYSSENNGIVTYDIRFLSPRDNHLVPSGKVLHTLEHFLADYFRTKTNEDFSSSVVYVGPMGCKTGFYLLTSFNWKCEEIRDLVLDCCNLILCSSSIPGASEIECGNHKFFDLEKTKEFIVDIIIPAFQTDNLNTDYPFFI